MRGYNVSLIMVALGGNAFLRKGGRGSVEEQWYNVSRAAEQIVEMIGRGYKVIVTHGNGPQVGIVMEWMESLKDKIPPLTMDLATAMTQGWLGYMLQQAIGNEMEKRGLERRVVTLVNQVLVSPEDPAFENPTKYIGPYYSEREASELSKVKGWTMKRDPRGGWRRVVPSPDPRYNVEVEAIRLLVEEGFVVIASGGGGIPVYAGKSGLRGVEAVIDKDLAGALLAREVGADALLILTDVEGVYLDYGKPGQRLIRKLSLTRARELFEAGVFPPGSMGPKVLACIRFLEGGGKIAAIGHLEKAIEVVEGSSGTLFYK
ncbi:MAG: carbamate kinase [Desulfurococcales archaeon]|nr:carbamate kinase [Desulfurococcales archaeon]